MALILFILLFIVSKVLIFLLDINKFNNQVQYDDNNQPIISNNEIEKGLLNMIYRGIIPKSADLTPALNRNGCPLKLNNNMTARNRKREEIDTESNYDNTKYNCNQVNLMVNQQEISKSSNLFITEKSEKLQKISTLKNMNKKGSKYISENNILEEEEGKSLEILAKDCNKKL